MTPRAKNTYLHINQLLKITKEILAEFECPPPIRMKLKLNK